MKDQAPQRVFRISCSFPSLSDIMFCTLLFQKAIDIALLSEMALQKHFILYMKLLKSCLVRCIFFQFILKMSLFKLGIRLAELTFFMVGIYIT